MRRVSCASTSRSSIGAGSSSARLDRLARDLVEDHPAHRHLRLQLLRAGARRSPRPRGPRPSRAGARRRPSASASDRRRRASCPGRRRSSGSKSSSTRRPCAPVRLAACLLRDVGRALAAGRGCARCSTRRRIRGRGSRRWSSPWRAIRRSRARCMSGDTLAPARTFLQQSPRYSCRMAIRERPSCRRPSTSSSAASQLAGPARLVPAERRGVENLPADGGFVLAANHTSNFDPWPLGVPLWPTRQLLLHGQVRALLAAARAARCTAAGAFPVRRGERDTEAIETAVELCREGDVVAMFPEGTRRSEGAAQEVRARAAHRRGADRARRPACRSCPRRSRAPTGWRDSPRLRVAYGAPSRSTTSRATAAATRRRQATERLMDARSTRSRTRRCERAAARRRRRLARPPRLPRAAEVDPARGRPAGGTRSSGSRTCCSGSGRRSGRAPSSSAGTRSACRRTGTSCFPRYQSGREFDDDDPRAARPAARARRGDRDSSAARRAGYEADDFLGAAVAQEEARGGTTLVATSDRDAFQLASERTTILQPTKGVSELRRVGPAEVRERYGVEPAQVPDFIALRGDPSDKHPGRARRRRRRRPPRCSPVRHRSRRCSRPGGSRREAEDSAALPANRDDGRLRPAARSSSDQTPNWAEAPPLRASSGWAVSPAGSRQAAIERLTQPRARAPPPDRPPPRAARAARGAARGSRRVEASAGDRRAARCACHTPEHLERLAAIDRPTLARRRHARLRDELGGGAARGRAARSRRRARRLRARPPARPPRAGRPRDGLLPLQQRRVAARCAQAELGLERVAILDWDVHHGNGTQDIFVATTRASSTSRCTSGRSTRAPAARTSRHETTVNVPAAGRARATTEYAAAFDEIVEPAVARVRARPRCSSRPASTRTRTTRSREMRGDGRRLPRARAPVPRGSRRASPPCSRAATTSRHCRGSSQRRSKASQPEANGRLVRAGRSTRGNAVVIATRKLVSHHRPEALDAHHPRSSPTVR